jgi:hypothetical protein
MRFAFSPELRTGGGSASFEIALGGEKTGGGGAP